MRILKNADPVEELFATGEKKPKRTGPVGKAQELMTQVSDLPRKRQKLVLDIVESMVSAYKE